MTENQIARNGIVIFWNRTKAFGFLTDTTGDGGVQHDIFIHYSEIVAPLGRQYLTKGQRVVFQLGKYNGKDCAIRLQPGEIPLYATPPSLANTPLKTGGAQ